MNRLIEGGFVQTDGLYVTALSGEILIQGRIACLGEIVITVMKGIEVIEQAADPIVQTRFYNYNASIDSYSSFLRYDNSHIHPGHHDEHHKHEIDWRTGDERSGSPWWVGREGWPTLGQFIREVEAWYYENAQQLPNPAGVAKISS